MIFYFDLAFLGADNFTLLCELAGDFAGSNPTLRSIYQAIAEERQRRLTGESSLKGMEIAFDGVASELLLEAVDALAAAAQAASRLPAFRVVAFFVEAIQAITKQADRLRIPLPTIH